MQKTVAMPNAAAPSASFSSAMRLRSRVTIESTAGRPSAARIAAHARADPAIWPQLSATTTASKRAGSRADSFFTAPASPLNGGRHSAVTASRPELSVWPKSTLRCRHS